MTETEKNLLDEAALAAFGALMAKDLALTYEQLANKAWRLAGEFIKARKEYRASLYDRILNEYRGIEALRRILELDGNTGRCLDRLVDRYKDKDDPLRAYADEPSYAGRNTGQMAIIRFLENQAKESA